MPTRLSVPPIFRTFYRNLETDTYHVGSRTHPGFILSSKSRYLLGYYFILALAITGTAFLVTKTGIAQSIMAAARAQASAQYLTLKNRGNRSSIRLTSTAGLVALLSNEAQQFSGDTADGLRYQQIPSTVISTKQPVRLDDILANRSFTHWGILLNKPPKGTYSVEFSAKFPGTYRFTIYVADDAGIETVVAHQPITFNSNEHRRYLFEYYPSNPAGTQLVFKNIFYRNN